MSEKNTSTVHSNEQPNSAGNLQIDEEPKSASARSLEDVALDPPSTALKKAMQEANTAINEYSKSLGIIEETEKDLNSENTPTISDNLTVPSDEGLGPIGIFGTCPNTPGGASTLDGTTISSIGSASARQAMVARRKEIQLQNMRFFKQPQQQQVPSAILPSVSKESNSILASSKSGYEVEMDDDAETQVAGVAQDGRNRPARTSTTKPPVVGFLTRRRKFEISVVLLSFLAFVFTGTATDRCDFVQVGNDDLQNIWDMPDRNVGLVQFETIANDCEYWFNTPAVFGNIYDTVWDAARIMSLSATMLGFMLVGFLCTLSCITYRATTLQYFAFASLIIPLLHSMSFIVFGSDICQAGTCTIGLGALLMVFGLIIWFIVALVLFMIPEKDDQNTKAGSMEQNSDEIAERETLAAIRFQRNRLLLLVAIILVVATSAIVNVSVLLGHESGDVAFEDASSTATDPPEFDEQWLQAGEVTMGPYPDSHDYVSLSGNGSVMALIGKESVLVMDYDGTKALWYPFGGMIAANQEYNGLADGDRVTKVRATSISLSEDGRTIVIGSSSVATTNAGENYEFGKVQVWTYDTLSRRWLTKGTPIAGRAKNDYFGSTVEISDDGSRIAVLALGHLEKLKPYIRVYDFDSNGNWVQVGGDMELEYTWEPSGFAFSGDGSTIAMGSFRIGRIGLVTIWTLNPDSQSWQRQGSTITSNSSERDDRFGDAISLSRDGSVLAVGDPKESLGYVRVHAFKNGKWEKIGEDLHCNAVYGQCAHDVALSRNGSILAIAGYDIYQTVSVYEMTEEGTWNQVGPDIVGSEPKGTVQNTVVDMSSDGRSIAFGVTTHETMTHVWHYNGGDLSDIALQSSPIVEAFEQTEAPPVSPPNLTTTSDSDWTLQENVFVDVSEEIQPEMFDALAQSMSSNETARDPWNQKVHFGGVHYFLFSLSSEIVLYDITAGHFLSNIVLPTTRGTPTAIGVGNSRNIYVAYGLNVYRYNLQGSDETEIEVEATESVVDFQFDGDFVFINAGRTIITLDANTGSLVGQFSSESALVQGTSISSKHKRIFGRTKEERTSGRFNHRSELVYKEFNDQGSFVDEIVTTPTEKADFSTAAKTWMFPDQTRVLDDKGFVFSATSGDLVYSIACPEILDLTWLDNGEMIALHEDGLLTFVSKELVAVEVSKIAFAPLNIATVNGTLYTFAPDEASPNGIRVTPYNLELPAVSSTEQKLINATELAFNPEFPFIANDGLLYMLSKGHSSIFIMSPIDLIYIGSIPLAEIPAFVAYSDVNNEIYTYREGGSLCKIALDSDDDRSEIEIAQLSSTPLGLAAAGEVIFVVEQAGAYATHSIFSNNGTLLSSVGNNHVDKEYVWSQANEKMFFFRQADPTDLMTEHIYANGTIGHRYDSFLNNNSGFEYPIRVDPRGHHAFLGSGIIHSARDLHRLDVSLTNSVDDIAFTDNTVRTIHRAGDNLTKLQQWNGTTFELMKEVHLAGHAHSILAIDGATTIVLTIDTFGRPLVYTVIDSDLTLSDTSLPALPIEATSYTYNNIS